jgi:Asp-tRNA(Asn)/Glu-tRNA(Gln) amidotransferase A subunit family amidase
MFGAGNGMSERHVLLQDAALAPLAAALREGSLGLQDYIAATCERIDEIDPLLEAFVPEPDRRARLQADAEALSSRYPDPVERPALYGVLAGIKDIFRVDGLPTRAGSALPANVLAGAEAACVTRLRRAGALSAGKTVTAEFAFLEPGPTHNPHNLSHTPGGSSSGSAAAVAAGLCALAIGTQTVGSVIRPAAFCGIVGFKPSYGRIPADGVIYSSPSLDTIGIFTQDVAGMALAASVLCMGWQPARDLRRPVLGVPDGPYLAQTSAEGIRTFEATLAAVQAAGYEVRRVPVLREIAAIARRHTRLVAGEMARVHRDWFGGYGDLYRPQTAALIREGVDIGDDELGEARASRIVLREELAQTMQVAGIDLWVCPAAPGPAPGSLVTTGNSAMNLPWTHAGLPAITVPAGRSSDGLPFGLQIVAPFMADEHLLEWAEELAVVAKGVEVSMRLESGGENGQNHA